MTKVVEFVLFHVFSDCKQYKELFIPDPCFIHVLCKGPKKKPVFFSDILRIFDFFRVLW